MAWYLKNKFIDWTIRREAKKTKDKNVGNFRKWAKALKNYSLNHYLQENVKEKIYNSASILLRLSLQQV